MTPSQYQHARNALDWTHEQIAYVLRISPRQSFRYASGENPIPHLVAEKLRQLVKDKLTMSEKKFDAIVTQL